MMSSNFLNTLYTNVNETSNYVQGTVAINCRFAISVAYYGLTWLMTGLAGNKYLNFFIGGAVETVAYALILPVTKL